MAKEGIFSVPVCPTEERIGKAMSTFIEIIPFIELLLVLAIIGLSGLGYFSLQHGTNQFGQQQFKFTEKWVLTGFIALAILAISLLLMVSLAQG